MKNVEKMFSKPHKRNSEKRKSYVSSLVHVTLSSLKIAVNTVPILLT